ncbi:MAG: helix-turn-helix domain-containing protein [Anaerolineae bacterium]
MPPTKDIMTPQEVAEYLQVSPETVYRYIREGKLVASRLGRQYRIPKRSVEVLLLSTSMAGGARLRVFADAEVKEWLEEDEVDSETRDISDRLLEALERQ